MRTVVDMPDNVTALGHSARTAAVALVNFADARVDLAKEASFAKVGALAVARELALSELGMLVIMTRMAERCAGYEEGPKGIHRIVMAIRHGAVDRAEIVRLAHDLRSWASVLGTERPTILPVVPA